MKRHLIGAFLFLLIMGSVFRSYAENAPLTGKDIIIKSDSIYSGNDQKSKLTFNIKDPDGNIRKMVLYRLWKNYMVEPKSDFVTKVMILHEYPPETKGTAFMVWSYKGEKAKDDDQWIFLPILRKVNKVPGKEDKSFQGSEVKTTDMIPRYVEFDDHKLVGEETIDGKGYYIVESIPRRKDPNFDYSKLKKWISKDTFFNEKVEFYDHDGKLLRKQDISWKPVKNAFVWDKLVISNVQTGVQTTLTISDIEVDIGLDDNTFVTRKMELGLEALKDIGKR